MYLSNLQTLILDFTNGGVPAIGSRGMWSFRSGQIYPGCQFYSMNSKCMVLKWSSKFALILKRKQEMSHSFRFANGYFFPYPSNNNIHEILCLQDFYLHGELISTTLVRMESEYQVFLKLRLLGNI